MKKQQLRKLLDERKSEECVSIEVENKTYIVPKNKKKKFFKFLKKGKR